MFQVLYFLIQAIQPFLVPLCFVCAWGLMFLLLWSVGSAIADSVKRAKRMHQIPCANCVFFTGDYHLKCPVQPKIALSEEAIDCSDYRGRSLY
ncbi:MAG TPA: hypothetical protein VK211_26405 [Kamptonema sp.]|nr:hypothetical protein [Kamptonema sp.]